MKKKTEALAKKIAGEAFLENFLLVGGTALSVYLKHRSSEDLDFATTERKLPIKAISDFLNRLREDGSEIEDILPMAERQYAINEGCDIDDYHQDWSVDGVKLTFFTLPKENGREKLVEDPGEEWSKNLRFTAARKAALALNPDKSLPDFFFCLMRYSLTAALFAASQAP